jgi:hypothetical protein
MGKRLFDLNIEEVLENWEVHHAIREIIANALDEQVLSGTAAPEIVKERDDWHVRDFGRGIRIEHFTQNENPEKLSAPAGVIGKFGVGLKDALATCHRNGIEVTMRSRYGAFRLRTAAKTDFNEIQTLHVEYDDAPISMRGTDVLLSGVEDDAVTAAMALFLRFSSETEIESTTYGAVLEPTVQGPRVYILGVFANEETNFLFSYNVTSLTEVMKKKLNRERLNVGRSTYTERIVAILKQAGSERVKDALADQAGKAKGDQCDEMQWIEVSQHALTLLSETRQHQVVFVTEQQYQTHAPMIDNMKRDNYQVVIVGETQGAKLQQVVERGVAPIRTFSTYEREYQASFQYEFVSPEQLDPNERSVFDLAPRVLELVGVTANAPKVRISETIRTTFDNTGGVWDSDADAIVIKRSLLASPLNFAGTLLHEVAHATTGTQDATRDFENVLTDYLGLTGTAGLRGNSARSGSSHEGEPTAAAMDTEREQDISLLLNQARSLGLLGSARPTDVHCRHCKARLLDHGECPACGVVGRSDDELRAMDRTAAKLLLQRCIGRRTAAAAWGLRVR